MNYSLESEIDNASEIQKIFNNSKVIVRKIGNNLYFYKNNKCFAAYCKHSNYTWYQVHSTGSREKYLSVKIDEAILLFPEKEQKLLLFNLDLFL